MAERVASGVKSGRNVAIVLSFLAAALVGVPVWWRTTEIYRAPLPYDQIAYWSKSEHRSLTFAASVSVVVDSRLGVELKSFGDNLRSSIKKTAKLAQAAVSVDVSSTTADLSGLAAARSLEEEMKWVSNKDGAGVTNEYTFYIVADDSLTGEGSLKLTVGRERSAWMRVPAGADTAQTTTKAASAITGVVVDAFTPSTEVRAKSRRASHKSASSPVRSALNYRISFSLLNTDPGATRVSWDIQDALQHSLARFLHKVESVANFSVDSQVLYYTSLSLTPTPAADGSGYSVAASELPLFVNAGGWNVDKVAKPDHVTLNFLVYVPDPELQPLRIVGDDGKNAESNSFLLPKWGGVTVYNTLSAKGETPKLSVSLSRSDLEPSMALFLSQLRVLVGITAPRFTGNRDVTVHYVPAGADGVTLWELDSLFRDRAMANMYVATATLYDLSALLGRISNMVILDRVSADVVRATECMQTVQASVASPDGLLGALSASSEALAKAEAAFFDPTMLALLYFPDEYKYAIYTPFFGPISLPLLAGFVSEFRKWKAARRG